VGAQHIDGRNTGSAGQLTVVFFSGNILTVTFSCTDQVLLLSSPPKEKGRTEEMSFTPTVKHIPPYMAQREILARSSSNSSEPI